MKLSPDALRAAARAALRWDNRFDCNNAWFCRKVHIPVLSREARAIEIATKKACEEYG